MPTVDTIRSALELSANQDERRLRDAEVRRRDTANEQYRNQRQQEYNARVKLLQDKQEHDLEMGRRKAQSEGLHAFALAMKDSGGKLTASLPYFNASGEYTATHATVSADGQEYILTLADGKPPITIPKATLDMMGEQEAKKRDVLQKNVLTEDQKQVIALRAAQEKRAVQTEADRVAERDAKLKTDAQTAQDKADTAKETAKQKRIVDMTALETRLRTLAANAQKLAAASQDKTIKNNALYATQTYVARADKVQKMVDKEYGIPEDAPLPPEAPAAPEGPGLLSRGATAVGHAIVGGLPYAAAMAGLPQASPPPPDGVPAEQPAGDAGAPPEAAAGDPAATDAPASVTPVQTLPNQPAPVLKFRATPKAKGLNYEQYMAKARARNPSESDAEHHAYALKAGYLEPDVPPADVPPAETDAASTDIPPE